MRMIHYFEHRSMVDSLACATPWVPFAVERRRRRAGNEGGEGERKNSIIIGSDLM